MSEAEYRGSRYVEDVPRRRGLPRMALLGAIGGVAVVAILLILASQPPLEDNVGALPVLTISDTPDTRPTTIVPPSPMAVSSTNAAAPTSLPVAADFTTPTVLVIAEATEELTVTRVTDTPSPTLTATITATPTITPTSTATPTITPSPTETLPPEGLQGRQDLLAMLGQVSDASWTVEQFSQGVDGGYWRLGIGADTPGDRLAITLPAAMLETFYGNNAPSRITRVEAELLLATYNPPLLVNNDVYFGMLVQEAENPEAAVGLQVDVVRPGIINLRQHINAELRTISQRSVNSVIVRVRLERDPATGMVDVFVNNEQLGQSLPFASGDAPILPVLFVKDGGVIMNVTAWTLNLR